MFMVEMFNGGIASSLGFVAILSADDPCGSLSVPLGFLTTSIFEALRSACIKMPGSMSGDSGDYLFFKAID